MNDLKHSLCEKNWAYFYKQSFWMALLTGLLILNFSGPAQADDADDKRAIASWRAEGNVYPVGKGQEFYSGVMKGTFFVKDHTNKTHYMHAARMDCPFAVHINQAGNDVMQGTCQLTDQIGNKANAKISCEGHKENCQGKLTFTSGTGNFEGIQGGGAIKVRVDLVQDSTQNSDSSYGKNRTASGYLIINNLQDNVKDQDGHPVVH